MKITQLLIAVATLYGTATLAYAQTVSPQPPPTIITTAPITINTPGYYQLGANLTVTNTSGAIITINSGNVTLDFAGHYISGPSDSASIASGTLTGVLAVEKGNLIIENGTIAYCTVGIECYGNNSANSLNVNQTARNMLITYCGEWGIYFAAANYSQVTDCKISNITGFTGSNFIRSNAGVLLNLGTGNYFTRNSIVNVPNVSGGAAGYGIYAYDSSNNIARSNQLFICGTGLRNMDKYADNLTTGCSTPFSGGTDAGGNN